MTRHERKVQFNDQLAAQVKRSVKPVVLTGDFNVTPSEMDAIPPHSLRSEEQHADVRRRWKELWPQMGVHDVFRSENPKTRDVGSWFKYKDRQGVKARVDYVLATKSWFKVTNVEYLQQTGKEHNDHCPILFNVAA